MITEKWLPVRAVINNLVRREQINLRERLLPQLVGTLYSNILQDELKQLRELVLPTQFKLVYFKTSGKFYAAEMTEWPEDPSHWTGYAPLSSVRKLSKSLICVAMETPLGYPMMDPATE